jgi:hypothetical protein
MNKMKLMLRTNFGIIQLPFPFCTNALASSFKLMNQLFFSNKNKTTNLSEAHLKYFVFEYVVPS